MGSNNMSNVVLKTEGLTKRYGDLVAVYDLTLEIYRGEVFGFLGPNGAGKTTSINMMCGLLEPDAGTVTIDDVPIHAADDELRARVGVCPQEIVLWERLTCLEQLQFIGEMYGLSGVEAHQRAEMLLEELDLVEKREIQAQKLSGGLQRRLNVAMALVHDPELLILDEPTIGLDPAGMIEIRHLIRHLAEEQGKTILLSSHLLHEVEQVCDRVLILQHGQTIACGRVDELLEKGGHIEIRIDQVVQAVTVLQSLDWVSGARLREDVIYVDAPAERASDLNAALAAQGLYLRGLQVAERSLESYFLDVTASNQGSGIHG